MKLFATWSTTSLAFAAIEKTSVKSLRNMRFAFSLSLCFVFFFFGVLTCGVCSFSLSAGECLDADGYCNIFPSRVSSLLGDSAFSLLLLPLFSISFLFSFVLFRQANNNRGR
jgi:hypothetical protein